MGKKKSQENQIEKKRINFSASVMPLDENKSESNSIPSLYTNLISQAKGVKNIEGALYLASECLPLDVISGNTKFVKDVNNANMKSFVKSFVDPAPIPQIYQHDEDVFFSESNRPEIVGRILSVKKNANTNIANKSIYVGQMITDPDTIDRIYSMSDYSQSICFMPSGYICSECGGDVWQDTCEHYAGQVIEDKNGKKKTIVFEAIPDYAVENSFVLRPAYKDAMIKALEQNSVGSSISVQPSIALSSYNKKLMVNGMEFSAKSYEISPSSKKKDQTNGTIDNNSNKLLDRDFDGDNNSAVNEGDYEMTKEELNELTASIAAINTKVDLLSDESKKDKADNKDKQPDVPDTNSNIKPEDVPKETDTSSNGAEAIAKLAETFSTALTTLTDSVSKLVGETSGMVANVSKLLLKDGPVKPEDTPDKNGEDNSEKDTTDESDKDKKKAYENKSDKDKKPEGNDTSLDGDKVDNYSIPK